MAVNWRLFDSKLTEEVRSKPVLYNARLKEFRNANIKENASSVVAAEMGSLGRYSSGHQK